MSVPRLHGIYAVKIGNTLVGGIKRHTLRTASEVRQEATSGEVYSRFQSLYAQKPMFEFSTLNIVTALGACALTGTAVTSALPILCWGQKHQEGGARVATSAHRKFTINEGLVIPRRLTVEHQGDAVLDYEILATYDGTNEPITVAESQSLPTPTDSERFTLGPIQLTDDDSGEYDFEGIKRLEFDFGIQAETVGADSQIWDTMAHILEIQPTLTLHGVDSEWWKSTMVPLTGRSIRHTGTAIYLRKRKAGSTFVADNLAQHVKMTIAGLATIEELGGQGNNHKEISLKIPLKYDGSLAPVTFNTAIEIT
jgi:hypothetical protein